MSNQYSKGTTLDRIKPSIRDDKDVCWIWHLKKQKNGYGCMTVKGIKHNAHRVVYEALVGDIPKDMELDHVCHSSDKNCVGGINCEHRICVNPYHMEIVTKKENMRRVKQHMTHCKNGHEFIIDNIYITPDNRRQCKICNELRRAKYESRKNNNV